MLKTLRRLFLISILFCYSSVAHSATLVRVLTGTKSQSFGANAPEQTGSSPFGLIAFADVGILNRTYLSFGTSFELSTDSFSTSGFSLYGGINYYFYGDAKALVSSNSSETSLELYQKLSAYGSFGVFDKNIRVRDPDTGVDGNESVGGLMIGFGATYNKSSRVFFNGHLQYLTSGLGTPEEYSSFELYAGVGLRL